MKPAVGAAVAVITMAVSGHAVQAIRSAPADAPNLVPWNQVGSIKLGQSATAVYAAYGRSNFHVLQRWGNNTQGYFRLHGSRVIVTFYGSRVGEIGFTTRYYRTTTDFGVGSTIPLGPCYRTATAGCEHHWRGFVYNAWNKGKPCRCWVKVGTGHQSLAITAHNFEKPWFFIYTQRGRATYLYFALKFVD